ncbi:MAG: cytochrome P450 [Pseudomonadota bacterium]
MPALPHSFPRVRLSPRDPDLVQDPYAFYARIHEQGSVFFWEDYGLVAFAGYEAVDALLRDRRFGRQILHVASRAELGWPEMPAHLHDFDRVERYSLLELEPPAHTKLRRLITSAFVSRQVETWRGAIRQTCHAQIDRLEPLGRGDLLTSYAMQVPLITICNLLGVAITHGQKLLDWSHAIVRMYVLDPTHEEQIAANKAARDFAVFLEEEIARKRATPGDDLLSALIEVEADGEKLTIDELISTTVVLLNAGHEASVHQFGNAVRTLLTSQQDVAGLTGTEESCALTVDEALRHDAPLHMFTRYALEDLSLEIEGQTLEFQKGDQIALLLGAANRDPRAFAEPHAFRPGRSDQKNVSFGAGVHFCIGAPLARIELQEMLSVLFERLPQCRLASAPRYADVYHFHGLETLDLEW